MVGFLLQSPLLRKLVNLAIFLRRNLRHLFWLKSLSVKIHGVCTPPLSEHIPHAAHVLHASLRDHIPRWLHAATLQRKLLRRSAAVQRPTTACRRAEGAAAGPSVCRCEAGEEHGADRFGMCAPSRGSTYALLCELRAAALWLAEPKARPGLL